MMCKNLTTKNVNDELVWWCSAKNDYASYFECTKNPCKFCVCGHTQAQHAMGTGFCGARTEKKPYECTCGKFRERKGGF